MEDDFLAATHIAETLESGGFRVAGPVPTVERALELAETGLTAALLDVNLGKECAVEVADRLVLLEIPFAFITASTDLSILPRRHRGHPTYLKPLSPGQILSIVHRLLAREPEEGDTPASNGSAAGD